MTPFGLDDTHDDARRVQLDLLRRATPERRAHIALSLSQTVIELSRRALRERFPDDSDREASLRWVALHYGADLAQRVDVYLAARGR